MRKPARFSYAATAPSMEGAGHLPYMPLSLNANGRSVSVSGLVDSGATVNVLPYAVGEALGFEWERQSVPVTLAGNLARWPARAVAISAVVEPFAAVKLVFAWTQATEVPMILGQVNFFMEFDVCFFRARSIFEVLPKRDR